MAGKTHPDTLRGLALMASGKSVRDAAVLVGVSPSTLSRALAKTGTEPRKAGRRKRELQSPSPDIGAG